MSKHQAGWQFSAAELIALRHAATQLSLNPNNRHLRGQTGNYLSRHKGRGMEFSENRPYQAGDDVRQIDWRVTARIGKPYTKLFQEERERPVLLCVDLSASMQFGSRQRFKAVQAAHLATLLAWAACAAGDRIGAVVFDGHQHTELKPKARKHGVLALIEAMVKHQQQAHAAAGFADALERLRRISTPGALVVVVSDLLQQSPHTLRLLRQICRHNEVIVTELRDPLENQLPVLGSIATVDSGVQTVPVDLRSKARVARLNQQLLHQRRQCLHDVAACGCRIVGISNTEPLLPQLGIWR